MKKVHLILFILCFSLYSCTQFRMSVSSYAPNIQYFELTDFLLLDEPFFIRIENIEVTHQIEVRNITDYFDVSVSGEYLIYNYGEEETLQLLLVSSTWFDNQTNPFTLRVNDSPFYHEIRNLINPEHYFPSIADLISEYSESVYSFASFNITFPHDSLTNITYALAGKYLINNETDEIRFLYNLASTDMWTGEIFERIEYRIVGIQPDYYSNTSYTFHKECRINYIPDGNSYSYKWLSDPILDDVIKITYYTNRIINWSSVGIFGSIFVLYVLIRNRRKQRNRI